MRVAFVVTDLGLGGTQAFVELAAVSLARLGHRITVFAEHGPFDRQERMEKRGIEVLTFETLPSLGEYRDQVAVRGIELIHLNVWERLDLLRGLKKSAGVPVVLSYHHVPYVRPWWARMIHPRLFISFLWNVVRESRGVDAHVGCCEASAKALRALFRPFCHQRVYALRNAIPVPPATEECVLRSSPRFLQVGSLTERKNPLATLRGFAEVVRKFPDATLIFVGGGPERGKLEEFVRMRKIPGVTFVGDVAEPSAYYAGANILVLPSSSEGLPYTLIEAAARGIPIIATDVDGIPEVVRHEENGILVSPGNNAALHEAMRLLAADAELRAMFGREGRRLVKERFEISRFTATLIDIYHTVLRRAGFGGEG